ncbi:hypothetical protein GALL_46240 [mine drainage metagenome]|uniref:Uncharacterized protein n=1 Tax=mine drainage metagenome TaxID=410659 RepID=A0A1J5T1X6_9ZZZZ
MGRQRNIKFVGTKANLIFYERKGGYYIRTKPVTVKQSRATHSSANNFGKASGLAKAIRLCAASILPFKPGRVLINSLNKNVYACLCNSNLTAAEALPFITGFEFNEKSKLAERFKIKIPIPVVNDEGIIVQLSAFNTKQQITAPAYTKKITLKIAAANINFKNPAVCSSNNVGLTIDYDNNSTAAQEINIPLTVTKGSLLLLMMALEYETHKNNFTKTVRDLRWMPAGIVNAVII